MTAESAAVERLVTLDEVKRDREVEAYIAKADEYTGAIGYTEHGLRHANLVCDERHGKFVVYSLHPDVFRAKTGGAAECLDLGCCRLELGDP